MEVLVFSSPYCSPCQQLKKLLAEHDISFTELNVETEEGREKACFYGVRGLPTTVIKENGTVISAFTGTSQRIVEEILSLTTSSRKLSTY